MNTNVVGSRVIREDAWGKVFGQTRFPADVNLPDQLYGVILRSPYPHARVRKILTDKAMELEGVVTVLTAKDVPHNSHGVLFRDHPVLAEYIRMVGDPVAVVGAETLEIARAAAKLVEVDYEVLCCQRRSLFIPRSSQLMSSTICQSAAERWKKVGLWQMW